MKSIFKILIFLLAIQFATKGITLYIISSDKTSSYIIDIEENPEPEKSEKENLKEKEISEEGALTAGSPPLVNYHISIHFQAHILIPMCSPYFEICSPPPELV